MCVFFAQSDRSMQMTVEFSRLPSQSTLASDWSPNNKRMDHQRKFGKRWSICSDQGNWNPSRRDRGRNLHKLSRQTVGRTTVYATKISRDPKWSSAPIATSLIIGTASTWARANSTDSLILRTMSPITVPKKSVSRKAGFVKQWSGLQLGAIRRISDTHRISNSFAASAKSFAYVWMESDITVPIARLQNFSDKSRNIFESWCSKFSEGSKFDEWLYIFCDVYLLYFGRVFSCLLSYTIDDCADHWPWTLTIDWPFRLSNKTSISTFAQRTTISLIPTVCMYVCMYVSLFETQKVTQVTE